MNYHKNSINLNNFEKLFHYYGFHLCEISGIGSAINHNPNTQNFKKRYFLRVTKLRNK